MPGNFRTLIFSDDDDFREELVERIVSLGFAVNTIRAPDEMSRMLAMHRFDWFFLDLALGQACLQIFVRLAANPTPPRLILIGDKDQAFLESMRSAAIQNGLEVNSVLNKPLSFTAIKDLVDGMPTRDAQSAETDTILRQSDSIPTDQIVLHYQPLIAMSDRTIRRVEALVRWRHPKLGLLRPVRFIALAERSGAIVPLTWEVLRRAIDQHVMWKNEGLLLSVSINVSALFLKSLQTAEEILELLRSRNCDPRHLVLEITETEATQDPPIARALLTRLRQAGVEVSMDDYGVGFSDLKRLRYFPFSDLKVDRWLVAKLASSDEARGIVEMLAALAEKEQFSLTGEGVETQEQWNFLEKLGFDFAQGFLIARPMPADKMQDWVDRVTGEGRFRPVVSY